MNNPITFILMWSSFYNFCVKRLLIHHKKARAKENDVKFVFPRQKTQILKVVIRFFCSSSFHQRETFCASSFLLLIVIIFTLKVVNLNDIIAFIQTIRFICYSHGRMKFFSLFSRATKMSILLWGIAYFSTYGLILSLVQSKVNIFVILIHCINHVWVWNFLTLSTRGMRH